MYSETNLINLNKESYIMKVCKHCGTKNEEDFIRGNGKIGVTVCTKCNGKIRSEMQKGEKNHNYRKKPTPDTLILMSEVQKGKTQSNKTRSMNSKYHKDHIEDILRKYPWLILHEEIREAMVQEIGKASIQIRCKRCNEWFTPTLRELANRIMSLKKGNDSCYFYCSDQCKNSCSIFRINPNYFIRNLNDNHIDKNDQSGISTWRNEVLTRQRNETLSCYNQCEICNSEINLEVHHEKPQKTHPHLALDPDNGIVLCHTCHFKHGHSGDCSTGSLANLICT